MLMLAKSEFGSLDWAVLLGYFVLLAVTGWLFARREPSGAKEYFLAGRQMPMWAVAISVLATSTSAATFIGAPEQTFNGDFSYLSANIGSIIAVFIVAFFFIPAFYRNNCTTVYDVVGIRYGQEARLATSWAFMIGRVFASGSRMFMAAIPLAMIVFRDTEPRHLILAIGVLTVVGVLYTLVGGIRSIIWTDVIQTVVFVGAAAGACWVLLGRIPASGGQIIQTLGNTPVGGGSKLTLLKLDTDPTVAFTLWTAIVGFTLQGVAAYGTDHDLAQRMLTCRSAVKGGQSVIMAIFIGLPVTALFMVIGALLWIFYRQPDLMGAARPAYEIEGGRDVFLNFILREMPVGMSGLMIAGLFAAGLGSFNSALNAMAAAFVSDVYQKRRPDRTDRHYMSVGRWAVVVWGVVLGAFAALCVAWHKASGQNLIDFALSVMAFAYAGMLAVFICALFTKRGSKHSAIAALLVGFVAVAAMDPATLKLIGRVFPEAKDLRVPLAFPWRLTIATALATVTCLLAKGSGRTLRQHEAAAAA